MEIKQGKCNKGGENNLQRSTESSHQTAASIYPRVQVHYPPNFLRKRTTFSPYLRKQVCFQIVSMP